MAGKTKVNIVTIQSDGSKQTHSFLIPNGVDGKNGTDGRDGDKGDTGVGVSQVTSTASIVGDNTKVDLKFTMTDGSTQTTSFNVKNGTDGQGGAGGSVDLQWWNPAVSAGNTQFQKNVADKLLVVVLNGLVQPSNAWADNGTTLDFGEGLLAGDVLNVLYLKGGNA